VREGFLDDLDEDDIVTIATATLEARRVSGVQAATFEQHKADVVAFVGGMFDELKKEKKDAKKEAPETDFPGWYHKWVSQLPKMMMKVLKKATAEKAKEGALGHLQKNMDEKKLSAAERGTYKGMVEEIVTRAITVNGWLGGLPVMAGARLQAGEKFPEVAQGIQNALATLMVGTSGAERAAYIAARNELLVKMEAAYKETIGKGGDVNAFYTKMFSTGS
jgi:hypothetical protein